MSETKEPQDPNKQDREPLNPEQESYVQSVVDHFLRKVFDSDEALHQAGDLAVVSKTLQALRDLDMGALGDAKRLGFVTFSFTPPLDIPVFKDPKQIDEDPRFQSAVLTLGRHLHDAILKKGNKPATEEQLLVSDIQAMRLGMPLITALSQAGWYMFDMIDTYGDNGAVIDGIGNDQIRAIDLRAIGPEIFLVRPVLDRAPDATKTITLPILDKWRLSELKVLGLKLQEQNDPKLTAFVQGTLGGVILDPLFPDDTNPDDS